MAADARAVRLRRLLEPASIAAVGGRRAALALEQSAAMGFDGGLWLVNPNVDRLAGMTAHPTLDSLPETPDAVLVAVGAESTIGVVREAERIGAGGVAAYASGFAEAGHGDRQEMLIDAAGDMPLLGPNCHGFVNATSGAVVWPDVHGLSRTDRGVAIVSQSGNLAINLTMQRRALPISYVISLGNQASVTAADCVAALVEDGRVTAVGLYLESLVDSVAFAEAALTAANNEVPIVVLKAGASDAGRSISATHTAALAGSATAYDALFERYGVTTAGSPEQLIGALTMLDGGRLEGRKAVSLSSSGGEAALVADLAAGTGVEFPEFDDATTRKLQRMLGNRVSVSNPLDYHTYIWGDRERMEETFGIALAAGIDVAMLVLDWPVDGVDDSDWWPALEAFCDAAFSTGVRGVITTSLPENLPPRVADHLARRTMPVVPGLAQCLAAIDTARPVDVTHTIHQPGTVSMERRRLDEAEAKELLAGCGLPVPSGAATSRTGLTAVADGFGFPVVLKSLGSAHRSEEGGVALDIRDTGELTAAADRMASLGDGFYVERMVTGVVAEILAGIMRHSIGWTLTVGAGGVNTELLDDTATMMLPVSPAQIAAALSSLRVGRLLEGYRSSPSGDVASAVRVIERLSRLAVDLEMEIEINPLLVCTEGVWIVDALVDRLGQTP